VLFTQGGIVVNRFLYPALNYDPVADFAPVSLLVTVPNVLVLPASSSAKSVEELIAKGKAESLNYGSAGNGTSSHLCGELFKRRAGIKMTHVPYRGTSLVINDLIAGRLDATMDNVSPLLPHIQSGALRALAVTTTEPSAVLPDVQPISRAGLPDFDVAAMVAALLPAKTPAEIIGKYHKGIASALAQPATRQKLEALGSAVIASSPAELARFMEKEGAIWEPVIREGNIKIGD
jgi:tripartite-type tricarboxylate transporter receptor subunit TctC